MTKHALIVDDAATMRRLVKRGADRTQIALPDAATGAATSGAVAFDLIVADLAASVADANDAARRSFTSEDVEDVTHPMLQ